MKLHVEDYVLIAVGIIVAVILLATTPARSAEPQTIAVQSWCDMGRDLDRVREAILAGNHDLYVRIMNEQDSACYDVRLSGQPPLLGQQVTFHEQYPMNNSTMCLQFWLFVPHESYIGGVTTNQGLMLSGVTWKSVKGNCPLVPSFSSVPEYAA